MTTPLILIRAMELALKLADISHTSAAAIIFVGQIHAPDTFEFVLGILAVLGLFHLLKSAFQEMNRIIWKIVVLIRRVTNWMQRSNSRL